MKRRGKLQCIWCPKRFEFNKGPYRHTDVASYLFIKE
jgi:hypothetical protein